MLNIQKGGSLEVCKRVIAATDGGDPHQGSGSEGEENKTKQKDPEDRKITK